MNTLRQYDTIRPEMRHAPDVQTGRGRSFESSRPWRINPIKPAVPERRRRKHTLLVPVPEFDSTGAPALPHKAGRRVAHYR